MLREWKRVQVATQERAAKSLPPLTDAEADEVIRRSFGLDEPSSPRSRRWCRSLLVPAAATRPLTVPSGSRSGGGRPGCCAVPADRQDAVLGWMAEQDDPVVDVPEGQVRVLVAPMGAGKSEHASRWWDEGLSAAQGDDEIEIPVWLDARRVYAGLDALSRRASAVTRRGPAAW